MCLCVDDEKSWNIEVESFGSGSFKQDLRADATQNKFREITLSSR